MMSLAPDKYHIAGNDARTMEMAGLFLENILETYLSGDEPREETFLRGDSNADGQVNLSDAVHTLGALFLAGEQPICDDAADADDSGVVDLTDGVYTLLALFRGGDPPPPPGAEACGVDPTVDELGCESFPPCR
jgi:hypothetical protein